MHSLIHSVHVQLRRQQRMGASILCLALALRCAPPDHANFATMLLVHVKIATLYRANQKFEVLSTGRLLLHE